MRGYLAAHRPENAISGSIPAGAGLPPPTQAAAATGRVYPRGCGATHNDHTHTTHGKGLSPRVRGYRRKKPLHGGPLRSIPAGAGLPRMVALWGPELEVYPRGCGATIQWHGGYPDNEGLSPRVRGYPAPKCQDSNVKEQYSLLSPKSTPLCRRERSRLPKVRHRHCKCNPRQGSVQRPDRFCRRYAVAWVKRPIWAFASRLRLSFINR